MEECKKIRKRIIELAHNAGSNGSHLGGSLSAVEILFSLFDSETNFSVSDVNRDRFILSKGHAALALYCVLETFHFLTKEEVDTFEKNGTSFFAHAKRMPSKGIEFSGGSLSLGVSYAVGAALAAKSRLSSSHIYVVVGDGECDEGLVWEAVMSACNYHLDNLTIIVDCNGLQSDGPTSEVMDHSPLSQKFQGFGCAVQDVNGHSVAELKSALQHLTAGRPNVIIAHTVKGKGVSFMENQPSWHHGTLNQKLYEQAIEDIEHGEI